MLEVSTTDLVSLLGDVGLRYRTGIILLSPAWLGLERELAARLGVSYLDHREWTLSRLAPGQRFLGTDWQELISRDLDGLISAAKPNRGCLLVANIDVLLCSLRLADRERFWKHLRESYRPAWGLLLALPKMHGRLIRGDELMRWADGGRLAAWE